MPMKVTVAGFLTSLLLLGVVNAQTPEATPPPDSSNTSHFTKLDRGVNLGNFLEAPTEGAWSNGRQIEETDFSIIKQAGFSIIRVPIRWAVYVREDKNPTIDPAFINRVDWVVAQAEKNNLRVILDYHNDDALMKSGDIFTHVAETPASRFIAIWKQIAEHYKDAPGSVWFELLNEPNGKLVGPDWNNLLAQTLAVVRATNPTRTVVVGPAHWNNISDLPKLILPDNDRNLVVTIHFYDPFHFTHQGAEWAKGSNAWLGTKWGTDADKQTVTKSFDQAAAWGVAHNRPIYLGEFGAYSKSPMEGRAQWTAFVARTAEQHGMAWTYWEFCSGFGVYDPDAKAWRQPLLNALLPK